MQIQLTGRNLDITPPLKERIEKKFAHIELHVHNITSIHVTLHIEGGRQLAEANLCAPGTTIHAEAESEDMYKTIDLLEKKCMRQIKKHKHKSNDHHD